ncbi:MAG: phosphoribosylanthranilate isomerase [Planctomycetota bacterium]
MIASNATRVKICGLTTPDAAEVAAIAGADLIGIVFAPKSPRYVSSATQIEEILAATQSVDVPPIAVGVFADTFDPPPPMYNVWREYGDWCQLHEPITLDVAARLVNSDPIRLVRGIAFDAEEIQSWDASGHAHALLVDGPHAGSGQTFDHSALIALMPDLQQPVFLAGGLTPDTVGEAIRTVHPFGVDVSSGVERERGVKDHDRIRAFIGAVRDADDERRRTAT